MAAQDMTLLPPSFFRTIFFVAIAAASLVLIDSVLANTERRETALEGARFYRDGQRLMQEGKYADAVDAFRSAIANERENAEYPLAMGQALLAAGQLDQAESTLSDLLKANSMAGAPNLSMARVFAKEGQFEEAASWYHRAIYGQWPRDAAANEVRVRFELADLLASRNSKADLLAELLPLQDLAPSDAATRSRLASLYMTAGSPARAAVILHDLVRARPRDPDTHERLGDAEFANGDYTAAQAAYSAAVRLRPDDQKARQSLELSDQVLSLDPLRRGLDGQERYQRSLRLVQLVTDRAAQCPADFRSGATGDLIDAAHFSLTRHLSANGQSDAAEANLDLADKLWQAEKTGCASVTSADDQPLQLVLAHAASQTDYH